MRGSKRALDLVVGLPATVLLGPVMAAIALIVLATSGRPILVRQTRVGAQEAPISVWKFRTMRVGVPVVAKADLAPAPDLYTPVGPVLRAWSLDELPQLVNVLRGDLSLVGPRPALPSQHDLIELRRRHGVLALRPGITGLAQVAGRESLTLPTKVRLEALYARRSSVCFDVVIMVRTVGALVSRRGAY